MIAVKVTADDFGYCKRRNEGMLLLVKEGIIQKLSLLVNGIACLDAVSSFNELPVNIKLNVEVGLHLNLTEGKPIAEKSSIPSLLDDSGKFLGKIGLRDKLADLSKDELRREIVNQIDKFKDLMGQLPPYVDGHQHIHVCSTIREVLSEVLYSHGIPKTRIPFELNINTCGWLSKPQQCFFNGVCDDSIIARNIFNERNVRSSNYFVGLSTMGKNMNHSNVRKAFENTLKAVDNEGLESGKIPEVEFMVHPGYKSLEGNGGCGLGPDDFSMSVEREAELNFLKDCFKEVVLLFNLQIEI